MSPSLINNNSNAKNPTFYLFLELPVLKASKTTFTASKANRIPKNVIIVNGCLKRGTIVSFTFR